jgi:hypothetical protein
MNRRKQLSSSGPSRLTRKGNKRVDPAGVLLIVPQVSLPHSISPLFAMDECETNRKRYLKAHGPQSFSKTSVGIMHQVSRPGRMFLDFWGLSRGSRS